MYMNLLVEKGIISEMECGSNFAYILKDSSGFLSTEYKVLQSQTGSRFIKCMKMLYNGKIELYYCINSYKPMSSILSNIDPERFITIAGNLLAGIIEVKNNGFLSCQNIDSSFDHIYVDMNTYKVSLVYLPLNKHEYDDCSAFENALRISLVKLISGLPSLSSPKITQFAADLQNGMMTLEDLCAALGGKRKSFDTIPPVEKRPAAHSYSMRFVAMNAPERVEFIINKDEFTIGKKETNDGIITFNKMISRNHCKITNRNGQYAICDLKSANGTYVNGRKLPPEQISPIKNGDIVRLANSDFQVIIQ